MSKEVSITIRLSEKEKREIAKACKKLGLRPGAFVKQAALDRLKAEGFVEASPFTIGAAISLALSGRITPEMIGEKSNGKAKVNEGQDDDTEEGEEDFEVEDREEKVKEKQPVVG